MAPTDSTAAPGYRTSSSALGLLPIPPRRAGTRVRQHADRSARSLARRFPSVTLPTTTLTPRTAFVCCPRKQRPRARRDSLRPQRAVPPGDASNKVPGAGNLAARHELPRHLVAPPLGCLDGLERHLPGQEGLESVGGALRL